MNDKINNHPLFSIAFRPMFILCAIQAVIIPTFWISVYFNILDFKGNIFTASSWHAHEMVFGFVLSLLAGFLLTASANWTNKPAFSGRPLVLLSCFWLIERIVVCIPMYKPLAVLFMQPFILYFLYLSWQMLKDNPKNRNMFMTILSLFFISKSLMIYGHLNEAIHIAVLSRDFAITLSLILIVIISGRLFPFFTQARMKNVVIKVPSIINTLSIASCVALLLPKQFISAELYTFINVMGLIFNTLRLAYWKPWKATSQPLLMCLHLGYLWIPVYFLMNASLYWFPQVNFSLAPLHAYATGALSAIALAMLYRVGLGHTGRDLKLSKLGYAAFFSLHLGALIRVITPVFWPEHYMESLHHASGWWTLAFLFYLWEFIPYFLKKRP